MSRLSAEANPSQMIQYARPSVDNLINNLPEVLKSSRQFLAWNVEAGRKKVPLRADGSAWGSYSDPNCWRTFDDVIELLSRGTAFGIGLVLPSQQAVDTLLEFNLIPGLLAIDADAKRSPIVKPYHVPENLCSYVRPFQSYTEFSPSLKGLRALAFGTLPTDKQSVTKRFGDGTELSLYRGGWVTLSGLPCADSLPTIEYRQEVLDHIVEELWPDLKVGTAVGANKTVSDVALPAYFGESFMLDWTRTVSEGRIWQFIQGHNRTPRQIELMTATWELKRGWNHGSTPDSSMYTKRIVEEALWLQPLVAWTLQDVIDIVITFCKKNQLLWSYGRAKKQIADGLKYIAIKRGQRAGRGSVDFASLIPPPYTPTLTCKNAQIITAQNRDAGSGSSTLCITDVVTEAEIKMRDTNGCLQTSRLSPKVSHDFKRKSVARDAVLLAIKTYSGWVKVTTIAAQTGLSLGASKKQLQRLRNAGFVDGNGKGRYRCHKERERRKRKPCSEKLIPKCRGTDQERKTLTRSELSKRGWPKDLIDKEFPAAGKDYIEKEILCRWSGRIVKTRLYRVSRIKAIELQPWFEIERPRMLRRLARTVGRGRTS